MKKIVTILFFTLFMGASHAEMSFGVSGALTELKASGTETEGGEKNSRDISHAILVPSVFAEYAITDRITLGVDYIPLSADVSNKTYTRNDVETSVTGTSTTAATSRKQQASAELSDHVSVYADVMGNDNLFVKLGAVEVDLTTDDNLATGSKYGDATLNGYMLGIGIKRETGTFGKFMKIEFVHTDYDDVSLTSTVARTGVTGNNKIEADLDTTAFKLSYAF